MRQQQNLPPELIFNILLRLSIKDIIKCRGVSKEWRGFISDPLFKRLHHEQYSEIKKALHVRSLDRRDGGIKYDNRLYTYSEMDENLLEDDLVFIDKGKSYSYVVSSNGGNLVCYVTDDDITICNPSTRELLTLPRGTQCYDEDNRSLEVHIGFAYLDNIQNEYRVVRLYYERENRDRMYLDSLVRCETLTLRDGDGGVDGWKQVEEICPYPFQGTFPPLVNHALHWLIGHEYWDTYMQDEHRIDERILAFNIITDKFDVIRAPPCFRAAALPVIGELRGCLALNRENERHYWVDIWLLKEYETNVWVKEYVIDFSKMDNSNPSPYYDLSDVLFYYINNNDEERLICCCGGRLDSYNVKSQTFKNLIMGNNWKPMEYREWRQFRLMFYQGGLFSLGTW